MTSRQRLSWTAWGLCSLIAGGALADRLLSTSRSKQLFLPGKTTNGHYQIELECEACHKTRFTSPDDLQAWALRVELRSGHNVATVALANRIARIAWRVWKDHRAFQHFSQVGPSGRGGRQPH